MTQVYVVAGSAPDTLYYALTCSTGPTQLLFRVAEHVTTRNGGVLAQSLSNDPVHLPKGKEHERGGLVRKHASSLLLVPSDRVS